MTRKDLASLSRDELIDLMLAESARLQAFRADHDELKLELKKGRKPPTNSSSSSQLTLSEQKSNAQTRASARVCIYLDNVRLGQAFCFLRVLWSENTCSKLLNC